MTEKQHIAHLIFVQNQLIAHLKREGKKTGAAYQYLHTLRRHEAA